MVLLIKYT